MTKSIGFCKLICHILDALRFERITRIGVIIRVHLTRGCGGLIAGRGGDVGVNFGLGAILRWNCTTVHLLYIT